MTQLEHLLTAVVVSGLTAVLFDACASPDNGGFTDTSDASLYGAGNAGVPGITPGSAGAGATGAPAGNAGYTGAAASTGVAGSTGATGATGTAGSTSAGCPSSTMYCPLSGAGTRCCMGSVCGMDFGMGCTQTPQDAGAGGAGGFTSSTGGRSGGGGSSGSGGRSAKDGGSGSGGRSSADGAATGGTPGSGGKGAGGDAGPPPPQTDASIIRDKG